MHCVHVDDDDHDEDGADDDDDGAKSHFYIQLIKDYCRYADGEPVHIIDTKYLLVSCACSCK